MKYTITAALLALGLVGCTTTDNAEEVVTAAPEAAPAVETEDAASETKPDCTPGDEDCDHTGTVFRPPTQS